MSCVASASRTKLGALGKPIRCSALTALYFKGQAHLPNERMSLSNLRRGKSVIERFLTNIAHIKLQSLDVSN